MIGSFNKQSKESDDASLNNVIQATIENIEGWDSINEIPLDGFDKIKIEFNTVKNKDNIDLNLENKVKKLEVALAGKVPNEGIKMYLVTLKSQLDNLNNDKTEEIGFITKNIEDLTLQNDKFLKLMESTTDNDAKNSITANIDKNNKRLERLRQEKKELSEKFRKDIEETKEKYENYNQQYLNIELEKNIKEKLLKLKIDDKMAEIGKDGVVGQQKDILNQKISLFKKRKELNEKLKSLEGKLETFLLSNPILKKKYEDKKNEENKEKLKKLTDNKFKKDSNIGKMLALINDSPPIKTIKDSNDEICKIETKVLRLKYAIIHLGGTKFFKQFEQDNGLSGGAVAPFPRLRSARAAAAAAAAAAGVCTSQPRERRLRI